MLNVFKLHGLPHLHIGVRYAGGANGARIALSPQKDWDVNQPKQLEKVLDILQSIQAQFNEKSGKTKISLADLIVLAGNAEIEAAAKAAGHSIEVPFTAGRMDASQEQTDIESFDVLEPIADGFRNYQKKQYSLSAEELLIESPFTNADSSGNDSTSRRFACSWSKS